MTSSDRSLKFYETERTRESWFFFLSLSGKKKRTSIQIINVNIGKENKWILYSFDFGKSAALIFLVGSFHVKYDSEEERWEAGVETQKNVRGEIGEWGRVPFNETYAPSLSTIYDGA